MKATSGDLPIGDAWGYEIKWDGMRIIAFIEDGEIRLQSSNLLDATASFPELEGLADSLSGVGSVVLDGEVIAFDDEGRPSFKRLQQRMHVSDRSAAALRATAVPAVFVGFDLLHLQGHDTVDLPFENRRKLLVDILETGPRWRTTDLHLDGGQDLLDVVTSQHLEGLVAKRLDSGYKPGKRSSLWRKIKPRRRQEMVVGGWVSGEGRRAGTIGALIAGVYDESGLRYCGRVGSGLGEREIEMWRTLLAPLERVDSPFVDAAPPPAGRTRTWVEPELVIEVAFAEWSDGFHIRHPSYLGRRTDKAPSSIVRESP